MSKKVNSRRDGLEKKFKFITRWVFGDILINLRSIKCIWRQNDLHEFKVYKWDFELDESSIGTLQLICAAIETYGRIMLGYGYKDEIGLSRESFISFIYHFFPKEYREKANDIYSHYRCGLLHSYVLGYNSQKGFFPTRAKKQYWDRHLWYTNSRNNSPSKERDVQHQRLIINIDTFFKDFREAVEKYIEIAIKDKKIDSFEIELIRRKKIEIKSSRKNAEKSLMEIPEDY